MKLVKTLPSKMWCCKTMHGCILYGHRWCLMNFDAQRNDFECLNVSSCEFFLLKNVLREKYDFWTLENDLIIKRHIYRVSKWNYCVLCKNSCRSLILERHFMATPQFLLCRHLFLGRHFMVTPYFLLCCHLFLGRHFMATPYLIFRI